MTVVTRYDKKVCSTGFDHPEALTSVDSQVGFTCCEQERKDVLTKCFDGTLSNKPERNDLTAKTHVLAERFFGPSHNIIVGKVEIDPKGVKIIVTSVISDKVKM